jgi:osmoprotectant transport system ATP-binding protein
MNAVDLRGVGKRFDHWVLRGVDLGIALGRATAIVGPSGCGKTTLLQLVNAVQRPDEGEIAVLGEPLPQAELPAFRRRFGYAVQGAGLFPHMTIADNVALIARLEGWSAARIRSRRGELFELAGLAESLHDRYPHQLSGGQQQRAGLCRALMLRPKLLLLDEPFAGIDAITRADLYPQFEQLREHEQVTTLLVTHDIAEARRLADEMVVLGDGGVVQAGTVDEVFAAPRNDFVRGLLASGA